MFLHLRSQNLYVMVLVMNKLIAIAYGEIPAECGPDEASMLALCDDVAGVLEAAGFRTSVLEIKLNLKETAERIKQMKPDIIFNLVDTIVGQSALGHFAPQLFEYLKIPYTGGSAEAIYLTTDKELTKRWLTLHKIACPKTWNPKIKTGQFMVKSTTDDGSVGIGAENCLMAGNKLSELITEKEEKFGSKWFAEQYIDGREFNVAIFAGKVLPMAEIVFVNYPKGKPKIIDYASKWLPDSFEYNNTQRRFDFPREDAPLLKKLEKISLQCWDIFNLSGYARIDFRVDNEGNPYVLEANVNPGLDRDAGFAAAAARAGITYEILLQDIVNHVQA